MIRFASLVLVMFPLVAAAAEPVDIGSRRELSVDHYLIERLDGTELRLHRPVDEGRVLAFDAPWEGPFCAYVTVIKAHAPLVTIQAYDRDLKSQTAGEGSFSMRFERYAPMPMGEQQRIVAQIARTHVEE